MLQDALGVFGIVHLWLVSFEGVLHGADGRVSHARYHVRVGIEGDRYVGVPYKLLDVLGVYTLTQQERCAGVLEEAGIGGGLCSAKVWVRWWGSRVVVAAWTALVCLGVFGRLML
jgi:hypothetical protein